jgi:chemotaxis protein MotB
MSGQDEETKANELVILRRSVGGEEGGHKGGVWKIAYADFMTAMMAFFLVMWLINSTDKKTLTQVATYFNPLRLTDKAPTTRGLHQSEGGVQSKEEHRGEPHQQLRKDKPEGKQVRPESVAPRKDEGARPAQTEEGIFRDPYALLARLANEAEEEQRRADAMARRGGEAYRDPFEPASRRPRQQAVQETAPKPPPQSAPVEQAKDAATKADAVPPPAVNEPKKQEEPEARKAADRAAERAMAERLEADIKQMVAQARSGALPHIEVTVTEEGLLISLTDDYDFGMFAIASAEPRPAMVVVMEKLAKVLAGQSERLIVRGHTDGRPYKSGTYDNWRLSTARAHMAYYMLVRGGIDEKRFERVEGHADRNLKIAGDPEAAQNRRIEILLRKAKP